MISGRAALRPAAVLALSALLLTGCTTESKDSPSDDRPDTAGGGAVEALAELEVRGSADSSGYDRRKFGSAWADVDGNSCNTRNDILRRDLADVGLDEDDCEVANGTLEVDPYTGDRVEFTAGRSKVDIDHLVPLSDAWEKGAGEWEPAKRIALANDPLNLLAVGASPNRQKGDKDAAEWLPAHEAYHCEYVALQIAVKRKYELWVTKDEHKAMSTVLEGCSDQKLPEPGEAPTSAPDRFGAPK